MRVRRGITRLGDLSAQVKEEGKEGEKDEGKGVGRGWILRRRERKEGGRTDAGKGRMGLAAEEAIGA